MVNNKLFNSIFGSLKPDYSEAEEQELTGKPDYWLMTVIALLLVLGTVMIFSSSFVIAARKGDPSIYLVKHLQWMVLALIAAIVATFVDYHQLRRFSIIAMVGVIGLLIAVLTLPEQFVPVTNEARRWVYPLGKNNDLQFQPSEIAKIVFIIYSAHWLSSKGDKVRNVLNGVLPFAVTTGVIFFLIYKEPDLGTALILLVIGALMFFIAGANLWHLLLGGTLGVGVVAALAFAASYRVDRWTAFFDPFSDMTGKAWHTQMNLIALGSGGLTGSGLGDSRQKFMWLPNVYTDSIFAVIGEELGMVGAVTVVLLFVMLGWRGLRIAFHAPDGFGRLIAVGVTVMIVAQALLNIAVIANLVPFTGIPLPFISYGGTSLVVTMAAIGVLLNVSRQQIADPQFLLHEENRSAEFRRRELERKKRQANRERREAQQKLEDVEHREARSRQRSETGEGQKEQLKVRQQADYWLERYEKRQRKVEKFKQEQTLIDTVEEVAVQEEKPTVAANSFLNYRANANTENQTPRKARQYQPRRDWAKIYEERHKRDKN